MSRNKITKRKFIKQGVFGIGALTCSLCNLDLYSRALRYDGSLIYSALPEDIDEWSIEAKYYVNTPKGLKCQLCPNECKMKPGEEGDCRTRINIDGKLYCIAYGNPCAVHVDPIEKKPLYHFY
ncbi:MAG: hypothetical protein K8R68_05395, partial [Bacteroidales bacterium]|nr:hypothetical protein [Bacteroidales bacterium]